jgi:hypothetical protein
LLAAAAFAVLSLGVPDSARADLVTFNGTGVGENVTITYTGLNGGNQVTGFAGQLMMLNAADQPFNAFCGDLAHVMGPVGTTYNVAPATPPTSSPGTVGALAYLTNTYLNSPGATVGLHGIADQNDGEAAVQLAIWELEYGSAFSYVGGGPPASAVAGFYADALANAGGTVVFQALATGDENPTVGQGILTPGAPAPTPVPEPSSLLLLGLGLAGLVTCRWRGQSKVLALA